MKTQIIQLEKHDDLISVRDKMGWAKAQRILLVFPIQTHNPILNRKLDLLLLQRHSQSLGAQLALVSRDRRLKRLTQSLGIPVFTSPRQAQNSTWRRLRIPKPVFFRDQPLVDYRATRPEIHPAQAWMERSLPARIGVFFLGLLAFFSLLAVFIPHVEIHLQTRQVQQSLTIPVSAGPQIEEVRLTGQLPAVVKKTVVEARDSLPASGMISIPQKAAQGSVVFTNLTQERLVVPQGTLVTTLGPDAVRFQTEAAVTLLPGSSDPQAAPVTAVHPGRDGNVGAGAIQAVEGDLGLSVLVTNPQAMKGGSNQNSPAPTAADLSALRRRLMDKLELAALADFKDQLSAGDRLAPDTLGQTRIITEDQDTPIDQPADHLSLTIRAEYQIWVVTGQAVEELGQSALNAGMKAGYSPLAGTFLARDEDAPILNGDTLQWKIHFERQLAPRLTGAALIPKILGKSLPEALQTLENSADLISPPQVITRPSWLPWMPLIPGQITISISTGVE